MKEIRLCYFLQSRNAREGFAFGIVALNLAEVFSLDNCELTIKISCIIDCVFPTGFPVGSVSGRADSISGKPDSIISQSTLTVPKKVNRKLSNSSYGDPLPVGIVAKAKSSSQASISSRTSSMQPSKAHKPPSRVQEEREDRYGMLCTRFHLNLCSRGLLDFSV